MRRSSRSRQRPLDVSSAIWMRLRRAPRARTCRPRAKGDRGRGTRRLQYQTSDRPQHGPEQEGGREAAREELADGRAHGVHVVGQVEEGVGQGRAEVGEDLHARERVDDTDEAEDGIGGVGQEREGRTATDEPQQELAQEAHDHAEEDVLVSADHEVACVLEEPLPRDLGGAPVRGLGQEHDDRHPEGWPERRASSGRRGHSAAEARSADIARPRQERAAGRRSR